MIYGIDKYGQKVYPKPGIKASCILCGATLIPKCGSINIWQWAHQRHHFDCDYESETLWHLQWKIYVQDHYGYNCEVPIEKNGKGRLADAITNTGQVIEFQHSHISIEEIEEEKISTIQCFGFLIVEMCGKKKDLS